MKKNAKSLVSLLLLIVIALSFTLLAGASQVREEDQAAEGGTTIRVAALPGTTSEMIQLAADSFKEKRPDVTIEIVEFDDNTLSAQAPRIFTAADNDLDMAWHWRLYSWQEMCDAGVFMPLNDLYQSEGWVDALGEDVTNLYLNKDGNYYGVCDDVVWIGNVFYNKGIFDELGLEPPETSEDLYSVAAVLKDNGYIPMAGIAGTTYGEHSWNVLAARMLSPEDYVKVCTPGDTEVWDSEAAVAVFDELGNQRDNIFQEGMAGQNLDAARALFLQEKAAMFVDGNWALTALDAEKPEGFEYGYIAFPSYGGNAPIVNYPGNAMHILSITDQPEVCKEFLAHLMSKEQQSALAASGILNPSRTDIDLSAAEGANPFVGEMYADMSSNGVVPLASMEHSSEFVQVLNETVQNFFVGAYDSQAAVAALKSAVEAEQ